MDLTILKDTSPWNWPHGASQQFRNILRDDRAQEAVEVALLQDCTLRDLSVAATSPPS